MPTLPEYYRILGISPKAGITDIKRRFRLLALKFHPDRNPRNPEAASRFREVAEAYGAICLRRSRQPASPKPRQDQTADDYRQKLCPGERGQIFRRRTIWRWVLPVLAGPIFATTSRFRSWRPSGGWKKTSTSGAWPRAPSVRPPACSRAPTTRTAPPVTAGAGVGPARDSLKSGPSAMTARGTAKS